MSEDLGKTVHSMADATKCVAEAAKSGIDMTQRALGWLAEMLGEDVAGLLKDRVFYWRAINALSLQEKLNQELAQRRIANPRTIPPRLAIPFLEAATLEDDSTLQERWARLLANAMDPAFDGSIERCFGKILEELSPLDCHVLEAYAAGTTSDEKAVVFTQSLASRLRVSEREVSISLGNLRRLELLHNQFIASRSQAPHALTDFGRAFLDACSCMAYSKAVRQVEDM